MKSNLFIAPILSSALFASANAFAACLVCWGGSCWSLAESSCNEANSTLSGMTCFTQGAQMYQPRTDHVLTDKGKAWLIQGGKKIPFGSDEMNAGFARLNAKFAAVPKNPADNKQKAAAFSAFFSKTDSGVVSPAVLTKFAKEMGIEIRNGRTAQQK